MTTNILTKDQEIVEINNAVVGSARLRYNPYIRHCIGNEDDHYDGQLREKIHKTVDYVVAQGFPEDKFAEAITSAATEFAQAQGKTVSSVYNRLPIVIEFVVSELQDVSVNNVYAGILNNMLKQFDRLAYNGGYGNKGINGNANVTILPTVSVTDVPSILSAVSKGYAELRKVGVRKSDYSGVAVGMTSGVASFLDSNMIETESGMSLLENTYKDSEIDEIPVTVYGITTEYIELYFRPMITIEHGAVPSVYSQESRNHGLDMSTLFAFESMAIKIEEKGAVVRIPVTLPVTLQKSK